MTRLRYNFVPAFILWATCFNLMAQLQSNLEVRALSPEGGVSYSLKTGTITYTNGVMVKYGNTVLTADSASVNQQTGETTAQGHVRIQQGDWFWVGDNIRYDFKTKQMQTEQFRAGRPPVFAKGHGLHGNLTNHVYSATNAFVTTDDISQPAHGIRAREITIVPGQYVEARDATLYLGPVPVFYFPYYRRSLNKKANQFSFIPGYRSSYGPFLLGRYQWFLNDELDGTVHLDYRQKRGVGVGPDVNLHLGRWGESTIKYYYLHDMDSGTNLLTGADNPENRQRVYFAYQSVPFTNLEVKSMVRYQSDPNLTRDFFEGEYTQDPQPNTYVDANKFWQNFSLDTYTEPRVNDFYDTVERLPEVRLTGYRQRLGPLPIYYQSDSSAGYYRRLFAETNSFSGTNNFYGERADTYQKLTLPITLFGWLNVTPHAGGRFTYYSQADGPGATTQEHYRGVFDTGAKLSFKVSRVWPDAQNRLCDLDGLRHIFEPSLDYVYVPAPSTPPSELPQFDYEGPSLWQVPITYPDYNSIDSIDNQNVLRFGLQNTLQTKRDGQVVDFINWNVETDWRLQPNSGQTTFSDIYSDFLTRPRSWLTLESLNRYNIHGESWRMALESVTIQPNNVWSWSGGYFYLSNDYGTSPTALGQGENTFMSSIYYRLNENWGFRATHRFDARAGRLQEQAYTVYRDLRSWTGALTFRVLDDGTGSEDFAVAFTFSLKAAPRHSPETDKAKTASLLGG